MDDPARNWNPVDQFWRSLYAVFNPRPDASPAKLERPRQLWDLPSLDGHHDSVLQRQMHPENHPDCIPYYAPPDYYTKLVLSPAHDVVHHAPPFWMVVQNFGMREYFQTTPLMVGLGSGTAYAYYAVKGLQWPKSLMTPIVIGSLSLSAAFAASYIDSERRLQGYAENAHDVEYWKRRVDLEKKYRTGELDRYAGSFSWETLRSVFGPKPVDKKALDESYYSQ